MIQLCISVPWVREYYVYYVSFIMDFAYILDVLILSTIHYLTFITNNQLLNLQEY